MDKIEIPKKGQKIVFKAVNGLFYSTKKLSKDKAYLVLNDPGKDSTWTLTLSNMYVQVENDIGEIIDINLENLKSIRVLRSERIDKLFKK